MTAPLRANEALLLLWSMRLLETPADAGLS